MNTRESAAWTALSAVLSRVEPPCVGDSRFIAEDLDDGERAEMRELCATCPALAYCAAYANAANARAGYWAGRDRNTRTTKGT